MLVRFKPGVDFAPQRLGIAQTGAYLDGQRMPVRLVDNAIESAVF